MPSGAFAQPVSGLPGAYQVTDPAAFWAQAPGERQGLIAMDLAAQQVVALTDARPGQAVLEVGCGRGYKSLALVASARRRGGAARVVGVDIHRFKVDVARKAAQTFGADSSELQFAELDLSAPKAVARLETQRISASFDSVLLDAPCSGLGTLRRAPDKRWRLQASDIDALAKLNLELLTQSASFVAPGGALLYATCTITPEENRDLIAAFLGSAEGRLFTIEAIRSDELSEVFAESLSEEGFFACLPQLNGPDGHFAARLRRTKNDAT